MPHPPYLKAGDTVAIVATAKKLEPGQIDGAISTIASWGLHVLEGPNLYASHHQFAGTDSQRAADLQWALDHPDVKAVIFARGGYGTARIVDQVDWTGFLQQPKWLCGFSDLTVALHHVFQHGGIPSYHAAMPIFFADGKPHPGAASLKASLFGENHRLNWEAHPLNRQGIAEGTLIGGNLSVLYSIQSTPSAVDFTDKILFIEDLTEYLYHLDRMWIQLKRSGQLERLAGLVVGQFTEMIDNPTPFGKQAEEILLDGVGSYGFPVAFNAPIGHVANNMAIPHGKKATLEIQELQSQLKWD